MKLLLYGSRGWIGGQFVAIADQAGILTHAGESRVDDLQSLTQEIKRVQPTHVVSLVGRTHGQIGETIYSTIDYLEQKGKLVDNIRDNLFSPLALVLLCHEHGIHCSYLGTGCIFTYDDQHPFGQEVNGFTEDALPNFSGSSYSVVKGFTDRLMQFFEHSVLNIRIRMPISNKKNSRNFITKITSYENICSIPNSMTVLPELLPIMLDMITKGATGTINLTNPGLISHNEILELYREIVDPSFRWQNFSKEEQDSILAADRSNNYLATDKLTGLYPQVRPIREAVVTCLRDYH